MWRVLLPGQSSRVKCVFFKKKMAFAITEKFRRAASSMLHKLTSIEDLASVLLHKSAVWFKLKKAKKITWFVFRDVSIDDKIPRENGILVWARFIVSGLFHGLNNVIYPLQSSQVDLLTKSKIFDSCSLCLWGCRLTLAWVAGRRREGIQNEAEREKETPSSAPALRALFFPLSRPFGQLPRKLASPRLGVLRAWPQEILKNGSG